VIAVGRAVPDVEVWIAPRERVRVRELAPPGAAALLLFYLFDWSST
jgi:hypothetical protein